MLDIPLFNDLTLRAINGYLSSGIGREKELTKIINILVRYYKNNVLLVGETGIGKKVLIELLATRIVKKQVPLILSNKSIINLNIFKIFFHEQGNVIEHYKKLFNKLIFKINLIICIDKLDTIFASKQDYPNISEILHLLKFILQVGNLQCIATIIPKYFKKFQSDLSFKKLFSTVYINELEVASSTKVLFYLRPFFEKIYHVTISNKAIETVILLSKRYISEGFLPNKAIELLDCLSSKIFIKINTNKKNNSLIVLILTESLRNLNYLRWEAFRNNNIVIQYIINEIEFVYQKYILFWLKNNNNYNIKISKSVQNLSKLTLFSTRFVEIVKLLLIKNLNLLLASKTHNFTRLKNIKIYTTKQNKSLYLLFFNRLNKFKKPIFNNYIFSIFLVEQWFNILKIDIFNIKRRKLLYILNFFPENIYSKLEQNIRKKNVTLINTEINSFNTFNETFKYIKPFIKEGIYASLLFKYKFNISKKQKIIIHNFLGHNLINYNNYFNKLSNKLNLYNTKLFSQNKITEKCVLQIISKIIKIPISNIIETDTVKLLTLEKSLHKNVIGQHEAVLAIANAIRRAKVGLKDPNRPIASFLFCGPTGVGKTEITKTLAEKLYGSKKQMIRFDMSEFMEKFNVSRLIGAPPGYIGYNEGGELTEAVKLKPHSIVLFDELEKAHPDILNILLQILEDGHLTDTSKKRIDFTNTIIIMTSNAAAATISNIFENFKTKSISKIYKHSKKIVVEKQFIKYKINFKNCINKCRNICKKYLFYKKIKTEKVPYFLSTKIFKKKSLYSLEQFKFLKQEVFTVLNKKFLPEFLNRIDEIIIFHPLTIDEIEKICELMLQNYIKRVASKKIIINISSAVKRLLSIKGYSVLYGARPLRRLITKFIENPVCEEILKNKLIKTINIDVNNNEIQIIKTFIKKLRY